MFKREPVGTYVVNICTNISCQLVGGEELLEHAEHTLGVRAGGTTADGLITLEDVECLAACTEAPCLQVNYRYRYKVTDEGFDQLVDDLRAGRLDDEIPPHGTLSRIRQHIPEQQRAGSALPGSSSEPAWLASRPKPPEAPDGGGAA
jgi:NADH-quinone oxidoreductase subunit E